MLDVKVVHDQLHIGRLAIRFMRTLRIPDDGRDYPLPPGLGTFPLHRVEDFADTVPASWKSHGGIFLPLYQREAMWLAFLAPDYRPMALKVAAGMVNALTGKPWSQTLSPDEQDYLVCPDQPWLDGIKTESGIIRQFVGMPLGMGYTVEGQVTGEEKFGGLQLLAFDPKPGRFPDEEPRRYRFRATLGSLAEAEPSSATYADAMAAGAPPPSAPAAQPRRVQAKGAEMGLGAGGRMRQAVYPDRYGVDTWDPTSFGRVYVHLVNSMMYRAITGCEPPPTPVDAHAYAQAGYPWFDVYDEDLGDLPGSEILKGVKSIKDKDAEKGFEGQQDDSGLDARPVVTYGASDPHRVKDGSW